MENRYEELEMEIIAFSMDDVIVTSGCVAEAPEQHL